MRFLKHKREKEREKIERGSKREREESSSPSRSDQFLTLSSFWVVHLLTCDHSISNCSQQRNEGEGKRKNWERRGKRRKKGKKKKEVRKKEVRKRRKKSKSWPKTSNEEIQISASDLYLLLWHCLTMSHSFFFSPFFLLFLSLLSEGKEGRKRGKRERERQREREREKSQPMPSRNHLRWVDVLRLSSLYLWIPDNFILRGKERVRSKLKERERERKRRRTKWEAVKKERENVWMMLWNGKILDWEEKDAFLTFLLGRFLVLFSSFLSIFSLPLFLFLPLSFSLRG